MNENNTEVIPSTEEITMESVPSTEEVTTETVSSTEEVTTETVSTTEEVTTESQTIENVSPLEPTSEDMRPVILVESQTEEPFYPIMEKRFEDYTVTECLLLYIFVCMLFVLIMKILEKRRL